MSDEYLPYNLSKSELRHIRDQFHRLLSGGAKEADWQRFFAKHPFALSNSLPIKLNPTDIVPLGRPGKSEPDFLIYPGSDNSLNTYGIVELKSPANKLVRRARRNVVVLTASAQTAVGQLRKYNRDYDTFAPQKTMTALRLKSHLFVVMGLTSDTRNFIDGIWDDRNDIFPSDIECLGYDELLFNFERGLPAPLVLEIKSQFPDNKKESQPSFDPRFDPDLLSRVIMLLYGVMDHGGPFWCYVAVKPSQFEAFKFAEREGAIDLYNFESFGEVIVSAEGEHPPEEVTEKVAEMYGADVDTFFKPMDPISEINRKIEEIQRTEPNVISEPVDLMSAVYEKIKALGNEESES